MGDERRGSNPAEINSEPDLKRGGMHLVGEGVTRNFLDILESDLKKTTRSVWKFLAFGAAVLLVAYFSLQGFSAPSYLIVPGVFAAAFILGAVWTRMFLLESYEASLRDHWNRWMRWSVSCRTVRECYAKVHALRTGVSWWVGGLLLTGLLIAHIVLLLVAVNGSAELMRILPLFVLDAGLLGFFAAVRLIQRRWYRRFLGSCNELLRAGSLGLWGVY